MCIRVASIDDHDVTRMGIRALLESAEGIELVAAHASVAEFLAVPQAPHVDVVLLDLRLNDGSDPFTNVAELAERGMKVLVYSSLESPYLLRRVVSAGISGVLDKTASADTVREAIAVAYGGDIYATAEWAGAIDSDNDFSTVHLSQRQREVLELYAMGESAKRVATITGLSVETVQDYLQRIRTKYSLENRQAHTKVDLFRRAQEDGYVPGPWEKL